MIRFLLILYTAVYTRAEGIADVTKIDARVHPNVLYCKDGSVLQSNDPKDSCVAWDALTNKNGENDKWKGVAQLLLNGKPGCTTTLIKIPGCTDPTRKAQMITNGHCTEKAGRFAARFGRFQGADESGWKTVNASRVLYSSRDYQDIGILELDKSYEDLKDIPAVEIADAPAPASRACTTVGIALQGFDDPKDEVLRRSLCQPMGEVPMIDTHNMWMNDQRMGLCPVTGGQSGSGYYCGDGKLHGLLHAGATPADKGVKGCLIDSCLYDGKGEPRLEMYNYGFDVTFLTKCYQGCELKPELDGCLLPDPGASIQVRRASPDPWPATLASSRFSMKSKFSEYEVKGCAPGTGCSCEDESGYRKIAGAEVHPEEFFPDGKTLTARPGEGPVFRFLCLRGAGDKKWKKNVLHYPIYLYAEKRLSL